MTHREALGLLRDFAKASLTHNVPDLRETELSIIVDFAEVSLREDTKETNKCMPQ